MAESERTLGANVKVAIMTSTSTARSGLHRQDAADIRRTVQMYADGFGSGDIRLFEEAFHPDAWIFLIEADGTPRAWRLDLETFRQWSGSGSAVIRILEVTRSGDVANVLLVWRSGAPDNTWVDLHNLLRIDGVWRITNKTATHISRAGDVPRI
jgi:ketosteroid isomerase-like protein